MVCRPRRQRSAPSSWCLLSTVLLLAGCTGATVGSGVGDAWLGRAPYYAGRAGPAGVIAYVPVTFQAGAAVPATFDLDDEPGTPVGALLGAMNAYLDSLAAGEGLVPVDPVRGTPPDVHFGCEQDELGDCVFTDEDGDGDPEMRLAVGRPSGEWTGGAAARLADAGAGALLVLTLETGNYWPRQTNWRGSKAVDLGTDRTVGLPWLTSLEDPVSVVQLTGSLVGPDGRAMGIGAEGLVARRTSIVLSGFDVQALASDDDVEALMTERVGEGADAPLVWQRAIDDLVRGLTSRVPRSGA